MANILCGMTLSHKLCHTIKCTEKLCNVSVDVDVSKSLPSIDSKLIRSGSTILRLFRDSALPYLCQFKYTEKHCNARSEPWQQIIAVGLGVEPDSNSTIASGGPLSQSYFRFNLGSEIFVQRKSFFSLEIDFLFGNLWSGENASGYFLEPRKSGRRKFLSAAPGCLPWVDALPTWVQLRSWEAPTVDDASFQALKYHSLDWWLTSLFPRAQLVRFTRMGRTPLYCYSVITIGTG